jgi:predicted phage-related endonuclease
MEDQIKAKICDMIGDADTAVIDGTTVATWKHQTRSSFDTKAFKEAHPELASQFTKTTNTRTFLLKGER